MDDATLVSRCLKGEQNAYSVLVRRYQNAVFGLAFSYIRNEQDAADLVQEALVKGYLHLDALKTPSSFGSWLKSIVVNSAKELFRKRSTMTAQILSLDAAASDLSRRARDEHRVSQQCGDLWEEVDQLPEIYRIPIVLHYHSGLSYNEIASFLGLPVSTVRERLQRGRRKLRRNLAEEMATMSVDVTDKVSEMICKIARAEIHEEIEVGDLRHVFLSIDVPTELNVVGHEGDQIIIRGHKTAIGEDEKQAEAALAGIQLLHDEVEDWIEAGQHEGERFCGTDLASTGELVPNIRKSGGRVSIFDGKPEEWGNGIFVEDVFPHIVPSRDLLKRMRGVVPTPAHRISLVYEKVFDMTLPRSILTDELREGFYSNWNDEDRTHGQVGRASLEIAVPSGTAITFGGRVDGRSALKGLRANVLAIRCLLREIKDVHGNIYLLHTYAKSIQNVEGNLLGFYHDRYDNGRWQEGKRLRPTPWPVKLEDISGDIELDVGNVNLDIHAPHGNVKIKNRTGSTTISAVEWADGSRWRLNSRAGNIAIKLSEELLQERHITGSTLSGEFDYAVLDQLLKSPMKANNPRMMVFSTKLAFADRPETMNHFNADILAVSESGDIRIDRLPA